MSINSILNKTPEDWNLTTLGDKVSVLTDYTANGSFASLKENVTYYNELNYAVLVRTTDLKKKKFKPERFTDQKGYEFLKKSVLYGGEILMANVGSIGEVYIVPEHDTPMTLAPNMYLIKYNEDLINTYAYYFMNSSLFMRQLLSKIASTTLQAVNKANFKSIKLPLPPLEEQKKIADILSTVDQKIAFVEDNISQTEELKKGLMQKLLTEGIGHTEFKDSEIGRIPVSWGVVQIKQLGSVVTGSTPKTSNKEFYNNGTKLWASPSDLGKSKEIKNTNTKLSDLGFNETRILPARSILVTCIGSTIGKIGIAYQEMSTNQQINSVVCNEKNDPDFYFYVLDQKKDYIKKLAGTQAVPLLNKTDFSMIKVIQAPLKEQKQIAEILSTVDQKLEVLKDKKESFKELKKGLMQKLLTGEVRV